MSRLKLGLVAAMAAVAVGLSSCSAIESMVDSTVDSAFESGLQKLSDSREAEPAPNEELAGDNTAEYVEALELLEGVEIKGRAPKTGYSREQFSNGWKDFDKNGCDERNDSLTRSLLEIKYKPGTRNCVVLSGIFHDPYTGKTIDFVRGQKTSSEVQVDHVVALSEAWQKGAQQWDADKRLKFANDPLNLLASDGPTNASKGDSDAATWLPPNKAFRCDYVARQTQVKAKYGAWMTKAEHEVIERILTKCK